MSEQAALAWFQGGWQQQQQLEDGPCWMRVEELTPPEEIMELGRSGPRLLCHNGLPKTAAWIDRHSQQVGEETAHDEPNGSMSQWAALEYWQSPLYDPPDTLEISPVFTNGAGQKSSTLPLFLKPSDLQNPEPLSSTSSSFSPDQQTSPFQFGTMTEPSSRRASPKHSPASEQSGIAAEVEELTKPKPKRGRPRLPRNEPHVCDDLPCHHVIDDSLGSRRVPHNQVEQKYRNGLNAELERLRETVAVAPSQAFAHLSNSTARPSKAMVLASAIDYIKSIEAERDQLADENQVLRGRNKRLRRERRANGNE